jgi:hypothetical protein
MKKFEEDCIIKTNVIHGKGKVKVYPCTGTGVLYRPYVEV